MSMNSLQDLKTTRDRLTGASASAAAPISEQQNEERKRMEEEKKKVEENKESEKEIIMVKLTWSNSRIRMYMYSQHSNQLPKCLCPAFLEFH